MDGISSLNSFLAVHKPQLILSGVPEHFWSTLCKKLRDQIFDSGLSFQLAMIDYEDSDKMPYDPLWTVIATKDIDRNDPSHIYLVDHAWTFKANSIKNNLRNVPGLLERMCSLMQVTGDTVEEKIEKVSEQVWKYAHTYAIGGSEFSIEERVPVWYVLDELGSGITHSDSPNFRAVPFIHVPDQMTYTLLFPVENVEEGDPVTRNFVEGHYPDPLQREAMLIPWKEYEHFQEDFTPQEPDSNYFLEGHIVETLPDLDLLRDRQRPEGKLKVFSEYQYINDYLTSPDFEIVGNENDADIIWYINHFKTFRELSRDSPNKFVNQFPFEYVITIKDLLAIVARRCSDKSTNTFNNKLETSPAWLPTTFNMKTELTKLVAYYMQRKKAGLDNHWICKPYNLARGLDTYITDNLNFLCRLPLSGPKIAQKYIENPVLFERPDVGLVKFDIRYVVLLKSVSPTEVYIYNNFFLRFSNKPFALNNLEDYEQHFTVMNYTEGASLYRLLCAQFKEAWGQQYPDYCWATVEKSIFTMFADLFTAATSKDAPCGIAKSPQSRALYAADIMLAWSEEGNEKVVQPKLLEMNWMPDCRRACEYYPAFYNDIFSVIFLDKEVDTCTKVL
ncbi:tubulin--tyrosine ligase-like protein 12 [Pectinophora gossypiella]|uniref:tubulin--tyrosine ligase-like protein 12 n=1 Tax=Pectinophora gossypiella TaxID=13191 RepID=UPI00214E9097|nr:tubulin--tyrosine ligase-like protein 12 [Pectinophora gossypiella]